MESFANASQQATATGSYRFTVGDFQCLSVCDGHMNYPVEDMFVNMPKDQAEELLRQHGLPTQHVTTPYACLYVDVGSHKVLIDTGDGPMVAAAAKFIFPNVDNSATVMGGLQRNLEAAGVQRSDVDTVIITHAHPDHVGGMMDETHKPMYPNAHYYIARDEWAFWHSDAASKLPPIFTQIAHGSLDPVQERTALVEDGDEVVPGIRVIATHGHTPGHIALSIKSGDAELLYVGDAVLHPLTLEHKDWVTAFDTLPAEAIASRQRLLGYAADTHALVHAFHFPPFPCLGHVVRSGEGFEWQPVA